jgi:RimJ/RimL family protein N-acetyltransferase
VTLTGRYASVVPLDAAAHAHELYECSRDPAVWTYLSYGPWSAEDNYRRALEQQQEQEDPLFFTVLVDGTPRGVVSYLRIEERMGSIEIGHIWYAPAIQRSPATTEVTYLLARHAFEDLGYRRFEWKCHALNARSRAAAERFGFTYEGTHRQAMVVKGRNRDTAWFSILDKEWPAVRAEFERWLDPANFDADGVQRSRLNASSASTNAWSGSSRS